MATLQFGKGIILKKSNNTINNSNNNCNNNCNNNGKLTKENNSQNIIEIKNVSFYYNETEGLPAVDNVSLNIKRGEFLAVLGHNGSGKSTLAKLLNGLLVPDSGEVLVNGLSTKDESQSINIKKTVGMVFQNPDNQIIASIVEEDVAFGPENLGFTPKESRERVESALKAVNMWEFRNKAPHKLSGGQKQRVAIAGVLAMQPECIVFDESTAMLDPKGRKEVMDTLLNLNKNNNITIILITHFMEEAAKAKKIAVMNNGKISAAGTPKNIFSDYKLITDTGLALPQPTELLHTLKENGINVDVSAVNSTDCIEVLSKLLLKEKEA